MINYLSKSNYNENPPTYNYLHFKHNQVLFEGGFRL